MTERLLSENNPNMLDRALVDPKHDLLERDPFVSGLVRSLIQDIYDDSGRVIGRKSSGFVVGLTGDWGLGKSTILNFTEAKLKQTEHVSVAFFNPWIFSGRDELLNGFFNALRDALGKSGKEHVRDLQSNLDKYRNAIEVFGEGAAATADLHGGSGTVSTVWNWVKKLKFGQPASLTPLEERKELERKLDKANQAVVVLIDELDRVENDEVRAVAQLIKAVGDIEGISYLVSYEPGRVAEALGRGHGEERTKSGERYLEKIVQYTVPVRPLFSNDAKLLLEATLTANKNSDFAWDELIEEEAFRSILRKIATPREIKRLIGSYSILYEMIRGEIKPLDVLAYCWILTKSPSLREKISVKLDEMVEDPSPEHLSARFLAFFGDRKSKPSVVDVLGSEAEPFEELLGLLFPRFGEDRRRDDFDGTRLSQRQNLVRLLFLGNPPDLIARNDIEELWGIEDELEIENRLRDYLSKSLLRTLIDRVDDLFETLPQEGDLRFWTTLARVLVRETDWIFTPDDLFNTASDAGEALLRIGARNKELGLRIQVIFHDLVEKNDLVLAPHMFRKILFRYGMTRHSPPEQEGSLILTKEETQQILEDEISRYRAAVINGFALRRLPSVHAIFAISNVQRWDHGLRSNLTKQLSSREAVQTFSALVVPPGYSIECEVLDELLVADEIQKTLEKFGEVKWWIQDPWVADSVRRLHATLSGQNTMRMQDEDD